MEYLFTERAHLMCPGMCFGIVLCIKALFEEKRIRDSFSVLAQAHPFLNALIGYERETNAYYYDITDSSKVSIDIKDEELYAPDSPVIMSEYEKITGRDIDLLNEGMLKAAAWKMGANTCFLLVFHHLLADGRGALGLAVELAEVYANGKKPGYAPEKLISSAEDLPKNSAMPLISRMLTNKANHDWAKEGHDPLFYREYHEYADKFLKTDKIRHSLRKTESAEVRKMRGECREHSVTVNDLLVARMLISESTDKVIIAADLRDRLPFYNKGALGNYSTAFSIAIKKKSNDEFALAQEVHKRVKSIISKPQQLYLILRCYAALDPALLDAAFMSAKNAYESKSAGFIGNMVFGFASPEGCSITNLGRIDNNIIDSGFFIPPASPAIRKTQGVLTINGEMMICTSER